MSEPRFKNPAIIGVRQTRPGPGLSLSKALNDLGTNTGNMMFTESLERVLANAKVFSFGFSQDPGIEHCDAIVLAAANWVNSYDDFSWLAAAVERTSVPLFIVGLGAQASTDMEIPKVADGTLRLLRLAEERSGAIAARGHFSCEVLEHYGITCAVPTGCPSLLAIGPQGPQIREFREDAPSTVSLHSTRHLFQKVGQFQNFLYQQSLKQGFNLVLQSELADMYVAADSFVDEETKRLSLEAVQYAYGQSDVATVQAYLKRHGRFFTSYEEWIDFMRTQSFCFGTRIHGTVAALKAGTPATLIAHDSRTREMAEIMNIPFVDSTAVPMSQDIRVANYYDAAAMARFTAGYPTYYGNYLDFFAKAGLEIRPEYRL